VIDAVLADELHAVAVAADATALLKYRVRVTY
jgi:hypothetical protein